jgi:hypothetical protein
VIERPTLLRLGLLFRHSHLSSHNLECRSSMDPRRSREISVTGRTMPWECFFLISLFIFLQQSRRVLAYSFHVTLHEIALGAILLFVSKESFPALLTIDRHSLITIHDTATFWFGHELSHIIIPVNNGVRMMLCSLYLRYVYTYPSFCKWRRAATEWHSNQTETHHK